MAFVLEHERDGSSESKIMHRRSFTIRTDFAVTVFVCPGVLQVVCQSGGGKVIVAIETQGRIFLVAVGERKSGS